MDGEIEATRVRAGRDLLAGLALVAIALFVIIASVRMPFFGDSGWRGSPGLTPGLIGLALLCLSGGLVVRALRAPPELGSWRFDIRALRAAGVFAIVLVYVAAVPQVGYLPATFVMLVVFQAAFARRWSLRFLLVWVLGLSVALTAALWWLFARVFLIPMP